MTRTPLSKQLNIAATGALIAAGLLTTLAFFFGLEWAVSETRGALRGAAFCGVFVVMSMVIALGLRRAAHSARLDEVSQ